MADGLVIAFWNRLQNATPHPQASWLSTPCTFGCPAWDIAILAEVRRHHVQAFAEILQPTSIRWWGDGVPNTSQAATAHGIAILGRDLEFADVERPRPSAADRPNIDAGLVEFATARLAGADIARPLPAERWITTTVEVRMQGTATRLRVAGWHAPYAAGRHVWDSLQNRLTKRAAYVELTAWATSVTDAGEAVVVGLDGNNWVDWLDEAPLDNVPRRRRDPLRRQLDEAGLFTAEHAFHGPNPGHGLKDTLRDAALQRRYSDGHGSQSLATSFGHPLAVTYRLKKDGHRMDRIYASRDVEVLEAGVCHGPLGRSDLATCVKGDDLAPGSDHALVWCRIDASR